MPRMSLIMRLGVVLGILCLVMPLGGGTASATSAYYKASSLPWISPAMNVCFGGEICGVNDKITIDLPVNSYIGVVEVKAHDNVGDKTEAHLVLYINGIKAGEKDVKAAGSTLWFQVSGPYSPWLGSQITLRSVHEDGGGKGESSVVQGITIWNDCWCHV